MIYLDEQTLEDDEKFSSMIANEKTFIRHNIKKQTTIQNTLLDYINKVSNHSYEIPLKDQDSAVQFLQYSKTYLNFCTENLNLLEDLLLKIKVSVYEYKNTKDREKLVEYSNTYMETMTTVSKNTLEIENFLFSISSSPLLNFSDFQTSIENTEEDTETLSKKKSVKYTGRLIDLDDEHKYQNNTLLISETKGKVVLPYTISTLKTEFKENLGEYLNIDDLIEKKYTLPYSSFKNVSFARFRETFKLVRKREHKSIKEAFLLGMELLFNYNLHPAIIAACRTQDELDIYLDYLDINETNKFDCFKIVFDIAPSLKANKQKNQLFE